MGRMLEVLNRTTTPPEEKKEPASPSPTGAEQAEADDGEDEVGVSFIEVGGPRSQINASADVLAATPARSSSAVKAPPIPADPEPQPQTEEGGVIPTISIWCSWTIRPGVKRDP